VELVTLWVRNILVEGQGWSWVQIVFVR